MNGIIFFQDNANTFVRLTCSTSNTGHAQGGTAYYRIAAAGSVSFLCSEIDAQVAEAIKKVEVSPQLLPLIKNCFTHDLEVFGGAAQPNERMRLTTALKQIDEEEARMVRLFASGKISEDVWEGLWEEWKDKRLRLSSALNTLTVEKETHITNIETALEFISCIGVLYNGLQRSDQKDLLRHIIERVEVNRAGLVTLKLRSPFAYLNSVAEDVQRIQRYVEPKAEQKKSGKTHAVHQGLTAIGMECSIPLQSG